MDTRRLETELEAIEQEMARWRERLKSYRPMELWYEDFVANRETETRRLLEFLDVSEYHDFHLAAGEVEPST